MGLSVFLLQYKFSGPQQSFYDALGSNGSGVQKEHSENCSSLLCDVSGTSAGETTVAGPGVAEAGRNHFQHGYTSLTCLASGLGGWREDCLQVVTPSNILLLSLESYTASFLLYLRQSSPVGWGWKVGAGGVKTWIPPLDGRAGKECAAMFEATTVTGCEHISNETNCGLSLNYTSTAFLGNSVLKPCKYVMCICNMESDFRLDRYVHCPAELLKVVQNTGCFLAVHKSPAHHRILCLLGVWPLNVRTVTVVTYLSPADWLPLLTQ